MSLRRQPSSVLSAAQSAALAAVRKAAGARLGEGGGGVVTPPAGYVIPFDSLTAAQLRARFGWTRTGAATMIDSGGVVRYGAHNLFLRSGDLSHATWSAVTGGGTLTGTSFAVSAANAYAYFGQLITPVTGQTYTARFTVTSSHTRSNVGVLVSGSTDNAKQLVDVVAGVPKLVVLSFTSTAPTSIVYVAIDTRSSSIPGAADMTGVTFTISEPCFMLGAQDLGYVPTTTSAIFLSRAQDYSYGVPGLLLEGARTNLVQKNQDPNDAAWSKFRASITPNAAIAPNGTTTAAAVVENTDNNTHELGLPITLAANTQVTVRQRVRRGVGTRNLRLTLYAGADGLRVTADIGAMTVSNGSYGTAVYTSGSITGPDALGYYLVTFTGIPSTANANPLVSWQMLNAANSSFYLGDGASSLIFGSLQIEAGAYATSDIPNPTTGTMTRAADVAEIGPGAEFDALFGVPSYGPDLLAGAGSFDSGAGWTPAGTWVISGGVASNSGAASNQNLSRTVPAVNGKRVRLNYTITGTGQVNVFVGGFFAGVKSAGTHSADVLAATSDVIPIAIAGFAGTFDNFTAREVIRQGTLVVEWIDVRCILGDLFVMRGDNAIDEFVSFYYEGGQIKCLCRAGAANQLAVTLGTPAQFTLNKVAISWGASGLSAVLNGGTVQANASAVIPAPTRALFTSALLAGQGAAKFVKTTTYQDQRTGAALQALTA
jgi:hypothetical protein